MSHLILKFLLLTTFVAILICRPERVLRRTTVLFRRRAFCGTVGEKGMELIDPDGRQA